MDAVIGRMAHVDLDKESVVIESIPDETFKLFLGGRGLAAKIMLENIAAGIAPLSPENILIFATGPVTGTGVPGSDRICVAAKSPLTGLLFNSSMGGRFASTLKQAGYDALTVRGKASRPKYLLLSEGSIELRTAEELVGKSPQAVLVNLAAGMENIEICATGVAGENMVKYANIVHPRLNGRSGIAGRGGLGAVMASKNLKAVVIKREKGSIRVHSEGLLKEVKERIQLNIESPTTFTKRLSLFGTCAGPHGINALGALGTRNLTSETFEYADNISVHSMERLKEVDYRRSVTCQSCPVACGKLCSLIGELRRIPEFETLYALGSMLGIGDLASIIRANDLCDQYGLDTISLGVSLAFAIECFQRGIITKETASGRDLKFGDGDLLLHLVEDTARHRGLGSILAEGTRRMSSALGQDSWKYAYQAKGLEVVGHSARALKGMSIGYATGTRGGSHQDSRPRYGPDMSDYEGKVEQAIASQNTSAVGDSLTQCRFIMESGCGMNFNETYTDLLKGVTGWVPEVDEINEIGDRISNMERLFNVREGISRKDDTLPYRVMWEEIPQGLRKGQRTPPEKLAEMLDSYYRLRGWDQNGIPLSKTLECLNLIEYSTA